MRIVTKCILGFAIGWLADVATPAFAGSVEQFDANVFARVRDGQGALRFAELDVARQGETTYADSHSEAIAGTSSAADYRFDAAAQSGSFRAEFNHIKSSLRNGNDWLVKSDGTIDFVLSEAAAFVISGIYSTFSEAGLHQIVGLYNITDESNVTEVFSSQQFLEGTGASLTVGGNNGAVSGLANGMLPAGTYRFTYSVYMEAINGGTRIGGSTGTPGDPSHGGGGPPSDRDTFGTGFVNLSLSTNPVPLPPAVWAGMCLIGVFGIRRAANKWRTQQVE